MHGLNRPIARPLPPAARREPTFTVQHGVEFVDEYAWLRAANWQDVMRDPAVLDPQIRAYLDAENAYTEAALGDTAELQAALYAEMKARIKEDDSSVPAPDGPFEYYFAYVTGGQYPRVCRRRRGGGPEEILIDGNKEAEGQRYWQLGAAAHSPDHRYLAYAVDKKGSELAPARGLWAIHLRDDEELRDFAFEYCHGIGEKSYDGDLRKAFGSRTNADGDKEPKLDDDSWSSVDKATATLDKRFKKWLYPAKSS